RVKLPVDRNARAACQIAEGAGGIARRKREREECLDQRRRLLRERRGVRIGSAFEKAFGNLVDAASAHRRDFRQIENIGDDAARALSVERAQGGEKSGALIRAAAFTAIPGKTRDKLAEIIGPP